MFLCMQCVCSTLVPEVWGTAAKKRTTATPAGSCQGSPDVSCHSAGLCEWSGPCWWRQARSDREWVRKNGAGKRTRLLPESNADPPNHPSSGTQGLESSRVIRTFADGTMA